jgi:parvulin-like peptidyl-prolyl isomerase
MTAWIRALPWLSLSVMVAVAPGCGGEAPAPAAPEAPAAANPATGPSSPVIARVADIEITAEEFEAAAQRTAPKEGEVFTPEERKEILDKLVVEKMLYAEARKQNIDRDPKVQKVMVNTLLRQDVYASVRNSDFTDEELVAYFEAHKDEFVVPEKVQVRRIFIKVGDRRTDAEAKALADDLRAKILKNPESFKDLAAEHSEDPYRRRGGDLGFVSNEPKPGVDPEVITKAFALEVGQVSEPFLAGGGYNIVMNAAKRERVDRTFEQMKGAVLRKVKNDKYKTLYDDYVAKIRGNYTVTVDDAALGAVEVKPGRRAMLGAEDLNPFPHE